MTVLIAADKFKGSLSADEVCMAVAEGFVTALPDAVINQIPLADGGEGTAKILTALSGGRIVSCDARDPLGRIIKARFGISHNGQDAFIEMAEASGLMKLSADERNPAHTSTVGTGDMIRAALDLGVHRIILGVGGSATHDVGAGMATALGYRFSDSDMNEVVPIGRNLSKINAIGSTSCDKRINNTSFVVLCDVKNPLLGDDGSAKVFSPQKGADAETVRILEEGTAVFAAAIEQWSHRNLNFPGAGAAGGLGAGAVAFLSASIESGADFISEYASLEDRVKEADLVVSGEGRADSQTLSGKVVSRVATLCKKYGKPLWLVAGVSTLSEVELDSLGISRVIGLVNRGASPEHAIANAKALIKIHIAEEARKLPFS